MYLERILITFSIVGFACCVVSGPEKMTKRDFLACFNTPEFSVQEDIEFDATTSCLLAGAIKDVNSFNRTYERVSNDIASTAHRVDHFIQNKGNKTPIDLSFLTLCTISTSFAKRSPSLSKVLDVFKACDENAINWELLAQRMNTEIRSIVTAGDTKHCFDGIYVKERAAESSTLQDLLDNKTLFKDLKPLTKYTINTLFASSEPQKIFTGFHLDYKDWTSLAQNGDGTKQAFKQLSINPSFAVSHIVEKLLYAENYLNLQFDYNELSRILATNTTKRSPDSEVPTPTSKRVRRDTMEDNLTSTPSHAINGRVINRQTGLPDDLLHFLAIKIFNAWKLSTHSNPINTLCTTLGFSDDDFAAFDAHKDSHLIRERLRRLRSKIGAEQLTSDLIASLVEDDLDDIIDYIEKHKPFTNTSNFRNIFPQAHGSALTDGCIRHIAQPLFTTSSFERGSIQSLLIQLGMRLEDVDRCNGWEIRSSEDASKLLRAWVQTRPDLDHTKALIACLQDVGRMDIIQNINDFNPANAGQRTSTTSTSFTNRNER